MQKIVCLWPRVEEKDVGGILYNEGPWLCVSVKL